MSQPEDKVKDDAGFFDTFNVSSIGDAFRDAIKGTGDVVSKLSDSSASLVSKDPHKRGMFQAGLTMLGHGLGSNVRDRTNPFIEGAGAYFGHIDEQARIAKEDELREAALGREEEALGYTRGRDTLQDERYVSEKELAAKQYADKLEHEKFLRDTARMKVQAAGAKSLPSVYTKGMKDLVTSHIQSLEDEIRKIVPDPDNPQTLEASPIYSGSEAREAAHSMTNQLRNLEAFLMTLRGMKEGQTLDQGQMVAYKNLFTQLHGNPKTVRDE